MAKDNVGVEIGLSERGGGSSQPPPSSPVQPSIPASPSGATPPVQAPVPPQLQPTNTSNIPTGTPYQGPPDVENSRAWAEREGWDWNDQLGIAVEPPPPIEPPETGLFGMGPDGLLKASVAVSALTVAFDILVETVTNLDNEFQEMVRRGANYNASVGIASEMSDLKVTMAEMRRANELQGELVNFADARSDLSVTIKDTATEFSRTILPLFTEGTRTAKHLLDVVKNIYVFLVNTFGNDVLALVIMKAFVGAGVSPSVLKELNKLLEKIAQNTGPPPPDYSKMVDDLQHMFDLDAQMDFIDAKNIPRPRGKKF